MGGQTSCCNSDSRNTDKQKEYGDDDKPSDNPMKYGGAKPLSKRSNPSLSNRNFNSTNHGGSKVVVNP
jgi:hypothetical protein